jgi:hypothetical protein
MADLQSVAAAVVTELEAASLGYTLTVTREFDPQIDLLSLPLGADDEASITVVGRSVETIREDRTELRDTFVVDIGIRARLEQSYDTTADALAVLTRKIGDYFWEGTVDGTRCIESATPTPFSPTHIAEHQAWASVVSITFQQTRAIPAKGA